MPDTAAEIETDGGDVLLERRKLLDVAFESIMQATQRVHIKCT